MLESGVSHANAFLKHKNQLNSEEHGDLLLNTPVSKQIKMLLLFLTGNTLLIDGESLPFPFCACINSNVSCSLPFNCS